MNYITSRRRTNTLFVILCVLLAMYSVFYYISATLPKIVMTLYQYSLLLLLLSYNIKYLSQVARNRFCVSAVFLSVLIFLSFLFSDSSSANQLKCVLFALWVISPFIYERYDPKILMVFLVIVIFGQLWSFYYSLSSLRLVDENAYGGGYFPLVSLPLGLFLLRNAKVRYKIIWSLIVFLLVLISVKRGDILACILGIFVYFFVQLKSNGRLSFSLLLIMVVVAIAGYFIFDYLLNNSYLFYVRYQDTLEGNSSGRDDIYTRIIDYYFNYASLDEQILGGGFDKTLMVANIRAHSDWLEILMSCGAVGFITYGIMYLNAYKQAKKVIDISLKPIFYCVLVILLVKSVFSMCLYSASTIYLTMICGIMLNPYVNEKYDEY